MPKPKFGYSNKKQNKNKTEENEKAPSNPSKKKVFSYKDGDHFEVETIKDHRTNEVGTLVFFVKWIGWGDNYNTWEPLVHLSNVWNLIIDYENKIKNKEYTQMELQQRKSFDEEFNSNQNNKNNENMEVEYDSDSFGSIEKDVPLSIKGIKKENEKIYLLIDWVIRHKNGIKPMQSIVERNVFKFKYPEVLIEFYENHLKIRK